MPVVAPLTQKMEDIGISQTHRDIVEDRYRELRRPRRVKFFVNGDRYFKGKKLFITPNRYFNFNDLLNDLTKKLPQNVYLPYGVRQIFTPLSGDNIKNIEELQDGKSYVCAGFEPFKAVKYGNFEMEPWSIGRPNEQVSLDLSKGNGTPGRDRVNAFNPSRFFHSSLNSPRKYVSFPFGLANQSGQNENGLRRPKLVTIVRYGPRPRNSIKLLLNRQSVLSFEQLLADIADSFGPKWKNNKLRKLYTFRGKQVKGVSDFFREDDIFIGVGTENVSDNDIQDILEELQTNNPHAKNLMKQWDKTKRKRISQDRHIKFESEKLDSGFGSSEIGKKENENNEKNNNGILIGGNGTGRVTNYRPLQVNLDHHLKVNQSKDPRLVMMRVDKERERAAYEERVRARKRQKKLQENEKQILEEERRRANKPLGKESTKKTKEDRPTGSVNEDHTRQEKSELRQSPTDKNEVSNKHQKSELENNSNNCNINVVGASTQISQNSLLLTPRSKLGYQVTNENIMERYDLGRTLGYGNFAEVRETKQKNSNREMAMKIIDKQKLMGKAHMVESEIDILKMCRHPNIVKLYEEFETSDRIYLAMELVKLDYIHVDLSLYSKGGDLFDAITQSVKFREPDAAGMVKDLCNALFYLHSMRIVHRDLKPENLLVQWNKDGNMTLKLADFGLAMEVKEPIYTVCGTPTYVAPEILCQTGYGLEVDMWAIGVISFILLCGFPPFHSHDRCQSELFECIKSGEYEFLRPYWDDVSLHAKDLIEHLLLVDKTQRYTAPQVLAHPWILCGGDTSQILSGPELAEAQKTLHGQLDAEAKRNFEVFHRLKEQNN